jgi:predicted hydrocarbon binding protein
MPANTNEPIFRLKGNLFADPEYFRTDVTKGVTRTPTGTRMCSLPSDFLLGLRDALIYECGRSYSSVMKASGKRWGVQFIKRIDREMTTHYQSAFKDLLPGLQRTIIADAFNYHGYGKLSFENHESNPEIVIAEVRNPLLPQLVREADRPVDLLLCGLLASVVSHLTGKSYDCVQTECVTMGHESSKFILAPIGKLSDIVSWLDDTETYPSHDDVLAKLDTSASKAAKPVAEVTTTDEDTTTTEEVEQEQNEPETASVTA